MPAESQATSETCTYNCQQALLGDWAHCRNRPGNGEEGAGYGRSVCSESSGLHARNNGRDNGMQLRKEKLVLETLSKFRLRIVTHPHDVGIPSNQALA